MAYTGKSSNVDRSGDKKDLSFEAYAPICAGTTPTGPFQDVALDAAGTLLQCNGPGSLPSWNASPSVSSITINGGPLSHCSSGSWTPVLIGSSGSGNTTYAEQAGTYVRIGNIVCIDCSLSWSSTTTAGNLSIGGLPFACSNENGVAFCVVQAPTGLGITSSFVQCSPGLRELSIKTVSAVDGKISLLGVLSSGTINLSMVYQA